MPERRVFITGAGAVTPFGLGLQAFESGIFAGKNGVSPITGFDVTGLPSTIAAQVPYTNEELEKCLSEPKSAKTMNRPALFESIAAAEAIRGSALDLKFIDPYRVGVSMGSGGVGLVDQGYLESNRSIVLEAANGGSEAGSKAIWDATCRRVNPLTPLKALPNIPTAHIAIQFNARGPCQSISSACVSGALAIGEAFRLIRHRYADVMIAGAGDSMVNSSGLMGFATLGVLSRNNGDWQHASRPFDRHRDGFVIGEGAAIFILESEDFAVSRDAPLLAEVLGYSNTCDAYRLTDQPADGWGSIQAMRQALVDAGTDPSQIDYINAHGTGTPMNDRTETLAIKEVFGDSAARIAVSSTKSMIGHLVAAAGAVELAACVLALLRQRIPPTINYETPDPECDLDYVPNRSRAATLNCVLSNSFGFGGQNASLVLKRT